MEAVACVPWRPTPSRKPAFEVVRRWWEDLGVTVITADSDSSRPFNVSQARNNAVRKAGTHAVVVADADTIPDRDALGLVLQRLERGQVVYPFDRYRYIEDHDPSVEVQGLTASKEWGNSVGGLVVAMRETYWDIGGFDERFDRWGYEDNAFHMAANTLARVARVPGTVHAFGHDADRDTTPDNPGRHRMELYRYANRRPELMRQLIMPRSDR
jgi:hypothetical protein